MLVIVTPSQRIAHFLLSVPERAVRSAAGLSAGLLRELSDVAIPTTLRRTRLYQNLVEGSLRFLIEQVGQVEGAYPADSKLTDDFAIRRAAGNGIELVGILAFRASPVWVLAALADLSGAGRHLIQEIAAELKKNNLLEPHAEFQTMDQLLDGLERFSSQTAATINTPPLDTAELRKEWNTIRSQAVTLHTPAIESLERFWVELKQEAEHQNRSVFALSSLMALGALTAIPDGLRWLSRSAAVAARRTGAIFGEASLGYYRQTLAEIHQTGFLSYWIRQYRPYLKAAAEQFSPGRMSMTERILRR